MKLLFKQKMFSWLDSYDIYNEQGEVVFTVKGQLDWGHCLKIYDSSGQYAGMVREKVLTFLPRFDLYTGEDFMGSVQKEFTFFRPKYNIDFMGWQIEGNAMEWNYEIQDRKWDDRSADWKRNFSLDRYLCHGYRAARGCFICSDAGAGH